MGWQYVSDWNYCECGHEPSSHKNGTGRCNACDSYDRDSCYKYRRERKYVFEDGECKNCKCGLSAHMQKIVTNESGEQEVVSDRCKQNGCGCLKFEPRWCCGHCMNCNYGGTNRGPSYKQETYSLKSYDNLSETREILRRHSNIPDSCVHCGQYNCRCGMDR